MKTVWAVIVLVVLGASTLLAQAAPSDVPASKDDILKLFEVMQIRQQMRVVMQAVSEQQIAMVRDTARKRNPKITDREIGRLGDFMRELMKDFPVDELLDDMIPVYQKHLTKIDVGAMSAFYSSPTGQKLLRDMPAMTSESMQAAQGRMEKQMDIIMERVDRMIKEEHQQRMTPQAKPEPKSLQN
jgi:uncharacterized protein